jgi:hypothetical protein
MRPFTFLAIVLAMLLIQGCAALKPSDFRTGGPVFDPAKFFTGNTTSSGVIENRGGAPMQRVTTKTAGHWQGDTLQLEQDLLVGDNKPQHRSWRIRKLDAHHFEATANDVVGTIRGEAYGNVFHWSFPLKGAPGNPLGDVRMSQWMYLQPDGRTMINHSTIRKFGILVAQVTEQFRRQ